MKSEAIRSDTPAQRRLRPLQALVTVFQYLVLTIGLVIFLFPFYHMVIGSFKGVNQSYAIQAGREIRIIVRPDNVDDLAAIQLSKDVARKIEEMLEFPGQIKVTVIRETRAVDYAQ